MHKGVYQEFERIFDLHPPRGEIILELGVAPRRDTALLTAVASRNPASRRVGISLYVPDDLDPDLPFEMVRGNAHDLSMFDDESVDGVITNSMLEHDQEFWLTLAEVRRVLKPGGLFYVGVPGYKSSQSTFQRGLFRAASSRYSNYPVAKPFFNYLVGTRLVGTSTYMFHLGPDDYFRFSSEAVRNVFFKGMECLTLSEVMSPVRVVAVGRKPQVPTE